MTEQIRITLREVAERAGVSLKTAHRALKGESYVRDETRDRVRRAAQELGYRFNASASMLKRGVEARFLALIVSDLQNPFYGLIAKGLEEVLREHEVGLLVANSDEDPDRELQLVHEFAAQRVDAVVIVSTRTDHRDLVALQSATKFVFVDRLPVGLEADAVVLDDRTGIESAVRHLYEHGHRRIGFVADYPRLSTARNRLDAFVATARELELPDADKLVRSGAHDSATSVALTRSLLESDDPPTALIAANNRVAVGMLEAVFQAQQRVAVVGFDDFELAELLGVTVVRHDPVDLGRAAARLALDHDPMEVAAPRRLSVPTTLAPRGSGEIPVGGERRIRAEW